MPYRTPHQAPVLTQGPAKGEFGQGAKRISA